MTHAVMPANADLLYFAESLLRLYGGKEAPNRQLTKLKLLELLHLISASFSDKHEFATMLSALDNRERKSLKAFMLANFHKPLGIEDYAYLTGRSISTFTRDFKSRFDGAAPKQWLIDRRLEKARDLLAGNPAGSISEVAWESGYVNVPHFIKEFHKRYGITPKQFLIENRVNATV